MSKAKKIVIVGAGISGLTLAIACRQNGMDVLLIEKARPEDQLGTGINLQNNALRALGEVGVLDECIRVGFGWNTLSTCDSKGKVLDRRELPWKLSPGVPGALGIMRTQFAEILGSRAIEVGVNISYQTTIETLTETSDSIVVTLSDGRLVEADVLAASDGVYSSTRRLVFGDEHRPYFAGQGVWRYTVPRPKTLDGFKVFRSTSGTSLGALPLSEDIAYYFILESSEQPLRFGEADLAPALEKLLSEFEAPEIRETLEGVYAGRHISYRSFDILLMPQPWHKGRTVLVGDAAHSLTPQLTSGGGMAIEDAVVLADELNRHDNVAAALTAYGERREDRVRPIYENSLRICEIEKSRPTEAGEGVRIFVESFKLLADPY